MAALSVYTVYRRKRQCFVPVHGISDPTFILFFEYWETRIRPFFLFAVQNLSGCCIFLVAGRYCTRLCDFSCGSVRFAAVERMSASKEMRQGR